MRLLIENKPTNKIINFLVQEKKTPKKEVKRFIEDVKTLLGSVIKKEEPKSKVLLLPNFFHSKKYYKINDSIFFVEFKSEYEEFLIHPKFAHLEINYSDSFNYHYQVFANENSISFFINQKEIGTWSLKELHFFQGKFSMQIAQHIHQKEEKEWLGVFHASAISNGKKSILFLGDSGNGKSTSLAILQANGYVCLADDFVPIDVKKQEVYSFPSAISIKPNSLETLLPMYPELKTLAEYHFKQLNKIAQYLPPNNLDYTRHLPCKALVFIKYQKNSNLSIQKIDNLNAFEQLVPDSWLSPIFNNVEIFLDWFAQITCYQLTYSNHKKMIETVHKIFNDDV